MHQRTELRRHLAPQPRRRCQRDLHVAIPRRRAARRSSCGRTRRRCWEAGPLPGDTRRARCPAAAGSVRDRPGTASAGRRAAASSRRAWRRFTLVATAIDMVCRAARILDLLGAPQHVVHRLRQRSRGVPQVDQEYHHAWIAGLVDDGIERRVGNASAIPVRLATTFVAGNPGGSEPLASTWSGPIACRWLSKNSRSPVARLVAPRLSRTARRLISAKSANRRSVSNSGEVS